MKIEEYWQENRTFVLRVAGGLVLFLIALAVVDSWIGSDLRSERLRQNALRARLAQPTHGPAHEALAREDNEALRLALEELETRVAFRPRPGFREPGRSVSAARYLDAVAAVREELLPRARRRNVHVDPTFGLPAQSPTREDELARTLDGLDVVERLVSLAVDEGVERVERLRIRLDPSLTGRGGAGAVERTRVEVVLVGRGAALTRTLERTQREGHAPLMIESFRLESQRQRPGMAQLEMTLVAPLVTPFAPTEGVQG